MSIKVVFDNGRQLVTVRREQSAIRRLLKATNIEPYLL